MSKAFLRATFLLLLGSITTTLLASFAFSFVWLKPLAASFYKEDNRTSQPELKSIFLAQTPRLWRGDVATITSREGGHRSPVRVVAFNSSGQLLASGSSDGTIKLWNFDAESVNRTTPYPVSFKTVDQVTGLVFSPTENVLVSSNLSGSVRIWDLNSNNPSPKYTLDAHAYGLTAVSFSPDGQVIATGGRDKTIKIWNIQDGSFISEISTSQNILALAFSADGNTLVSGGDERIIDVWEWKTEKLIQTLGPYMRAIHAVEFSPRDPNVIAFSPNGLSDSAEVRPDGTHNTIQLWTLDGEFIKEFEEAHEEYITSISFGPDGATLISGSWDGLVKIWNVETGQVINSTDKHNTRVYSVDFHPTRLNIFATGSGDSSIRLWQATE